MSDPEPVLPATEDTVGVQQPEADPATPDVTERPFTTGGRNWTARLAGAGLAGTGRLGLAPLALVRFYLEGQAEPQCEAIIPAGRFRELFEAELARLLAEARPLHD